MDILLVEDDPMTRDMLARRLARRGYRVAEVAEGGGAIDAVRAIRPRLVLLDMSLPGKDGWTIAAEIKGDPRIGAIPVIGLTAHAMAGDRERALAAGCDEYESKPVDLVRLLAKIRALTGGALPPSP